MRITFPEFYTEFNQICQIAKSENQSNFNQYSQLKTKHRDLASVNLTEWISCGTVLIKITPAWLLAFQGEHKAVQFLLKNNANRAQALFGYAMAGNLKQINQNLKNPCNNDFYNVTRFLTYGGHYKTIFNFYDLYSPKNSNIKESIVNGFAVGIGGIGIAQNSRWMTYWLIENELFQNHKLLEQLLKYLENQNIAKISLLSATEVARKLLLREKNPAALFWPQLYVWFWQGPRLMKNYLPLDILIRIASYLCFKDQDAYFLGKQMPFIKTKQLLLGSLKSLEEKKPRLLHLISDFRQKREIDNLRNRLISIENPKLFSQHLNNEISQRATQLPTSTGSQPNEENQQILQTLIRCQSRL